MKKILILTLILLMLSSFSACGKQESAASGVEPASNEKTLSSSQKDGFHIQEVPADKRISDLTITALKTDKTVYNQGDEIMLTLTWTGTPDSSAWVGIIPADVTHGDEYINDDADLQYIYLETYGSGGDFLFYADMAPGMYTLRVNENDDGGAELAWCAFTVK